MRNDAALRANVGETPAPAEIGVESEQAIPDPPSAREESEARATSTVRRLALALVR